MSDNEHKDAKGSRSPRPGGDARVRRTQHLLHAAMGQLLRQKAYEDIGVKEILDRAAVARSTFYAHFGGKDALLLSALREIIDRSPSSNHDRPLGFSLPMFEHVERHRDVAGMPAPARQKRSVHDRLQAVVRDQVRRELARMPRRAGALPADLLAAYVASTFIVVFEWWVTCAPELPAREAHARFVSLVAPALANG